MSSCSILFAPSWRLFFNVFLTHTESLMLLNLDVYIIPMAFGIFPNALSPSKGGKLELPPRLELTINIVNIDVVVVCVCEKRARGREREIPMQGKAALNIKLSIISRAVEK